MDGKKPPAGSGWRPLSGELDYVGRSVAVSPAVSLEGYSQQHCEQLRKGAPLGALGKGLILQTLLWFMTVSFYRAQLIPRLVLSGALGTHIEDVMKK